MHDFTQHQNTSQYWRIGACYVHNRNFVRESCVYPLYEAIQPTLLTCCPNGFSNRCKFNDWLYRWEWLSVRLHRIPLRFWFLLNFCSTRYNQHECDKWVGSAMGWAVEVGSVERSSIFRFASQDKLQNWNHMVCACWSSISIRVNFAVTKRMEHRYGTVQFDCHAYISLLFATLNFRDIYSTKKRLEG